MEGFEMSIKELINYIANAYSLEDVCYILGKEPEWLLWKIKYELLSHSKDFLSGDDYYAEVGDYD